MGRAQLLIANLYAASANDCGDTQFKARAIYWLAADVARKAARVDESIKKLALKTAESYMGRAPSKTDIFTEGMKVAPLPLTVGYAVVLKFPSSNAADHIKWYLGPPAFSPYFFLVRFNCCVKRNAVHNTQPIGTVQISAWSIPIHLKYKPY